MVTRNRLRVGRKQVLPSRNFVDWKTDDPKELKRQLFDFEKHLSVLVEQNAQLLKIIDGNQTPNRVMPERGFLTFRGGLVRLTQDSRATIATIEHGDLPGGTLHEQADSTQDGFAPSTDGSTTGWVLTVQSDGTIAYAASTGVTDHGALTGLSDDDHTIYLLASGARALAGNWSLGGFNLTGAANISGTGSVALSSSAADLSLYGDTGIQVDAFGTGFNLYAPATVALTADGATLQMNALFFDANIGASGVEIDSVGDIEFDSSGGHITFLADGSGKDIAFTANDSIYQTATTGGIALGAATVIRLSAPSIDADNNPIHNVEFARFINQLMTQADASGNNDAFSVYGGVPHAVRSSSHNYVIDFPVHIQYGDAAEGSTQSVAINLTNIAGKDLSNGTVDFYSFVSFQQSGTGDDAYQERCHYSYYRAKNTASASITNGSDAWGDRQGTWNPDSFAHPNVLTISGSNDEIVTFEITLPGAAGTGRLLWVIRATGHGG